MTDKPPLDRVGYASRQTDVERDEHSYDRAMTVRLCRTFGWCLTILGVLLGLVSIPVGGLVALLVAVLVFLFPGAALLAARGAVGERKAGGAIAVLIVGVLLALAFGLVLLGSALAIAQASARARDMVVPAGISAVLLAGVLKLLYHDVRLLVAPGRGASVEAVHGLGHLFTADWDGVRRLGVLRILSGVGAAMLAGAMLRMSLAEAPAPPPAPMAAGAILTPMKEIVPKPGLGAADRAVVVAHFETYRKLDAEQRRALEDVLQECGTTLMQQAHWWKRPSMDNSPFPPLVLPLTQEEVARRLPIDAARSDQLSAAAGGQVPTRAGLRIAVGTLLWFWGGDTDDLAVHSERFRDLPRMEGFTTTGYLRGDAWILTEGPRYWSAGAITRLLRAAGDELRSRGASVIASPVTVSQAQTTMDIIRSKPLEGVSIAPASRLDVQAKLRADGVLELTKPRAAMVWVERDGTQQRESPEERARQVAETPTPRMLAVNPVAAGAWLVLAVLSAAVGAGLWVVSRRADAAGWKFARTLLVAATILTIAGAGALIWLVRELAAIDAAYGRWFSSPSGVVSLLIVALWTIGIGVLAPVLIGQQDFVPTPSAPNA
jgi:hypothetical protein